MVDVLLMVVVPLVMASLGARSAGRFFIAMFVVSLTFSLGVHTPIYPAIKDLTLRLGGDGICLAQLIGGNGANLLVKRGAIVDLILAVALVTSP